MGSRSKHLHDAGDNVKHPVWVGGAALERRRDKRSLCLDCDHLHSIQ